MAAPGTHASRLDIQGHYAALSLYIARGFFSKRSRTRSVPTTGSYCRRSASNPRCVFEKIADAVRLPWCSWGRKSGGAG